MSTYDLPRGYLSSSGYDLWTKDKNAFRNRYYLDIKQFETVETIFGKKVAKMLENREFVHNDVILYEKTEYRFEEFLDDLKIMGYLDGFNISDLSILEYKTGHKNKDGKVPWDNVKVAKNKQLLFYCVGIRKKHGSVNPIVTLQWLETEFKKKTWDVGGIEVEAQTRDLYLTGNIKTFKREIQQWEIDKMEQDIIRVAKEISNDYTLWKSTKKQ
jgi:hypothetical protein